MHENVPHTLDSFLFMLEWFPGVYVAMYLYLLSVSDCSLEKKMDERLFLNMEYSTYNRLLAVGI